MTQLDLDFTAPKLTPQSQRYTVYTIFDENGEKYGTFDTNDTGEIVAIKYVVGKFGNKITGMELSQEQAA